MMRVTSPFEHRPVLEVSVRCVIACWAAAEFAAMIFVSQAATTLNAVGLNGEGESSASRTGVMERPLQGMLPDTTVKKLAKHFGIDTVGDLLWHLPRRHYRRGDLTDFRDLKEEDFVTVAARIVNVERIQSHSYGPRGRKPARTVVTISDGSMLLDLVFFNMPPWQQEQLRVGESGLFSGTVSRFNKKLQLAHPEWEVFDDLDQSQQQSWASGLVPVYPAKKALSSITIRKSVRTVLDAIDVDQIPDIVPDTLRDELGLLPFGRALAAYHVPSTEPEFAAAGKSLKWREALVLQTYLVRMREFNKQIVSTSRPPGALLQRFDAILPFALTPDQQAVGDAIGADLLREYPMNRLVQGEVGSGKTVVALRAMLQVAQTGGQSVMLAPTEVLASQHFTSIVKQLGPLAAELNPVLITGQQPAAERRKAALAAASGQSSIIVGTHALFSEKTSFAELGLVVIDEQHRFGVRQREALRNKGIAPHTLLLTATPIPRTVAMTAFGDLDVSELRTMPEGRSPIETFVVQQDQQPAHFMRIWQRIAEDAARGRQAFVVCPAIAPGKAEKDIYIDEEASTQIAMADVETTLNNMRGLSVLDGLRMAPLTGAMSSDEKDRTMRAYASGELDLLVATTVIEVGVNVPNATVMVVMDAERFGLSQLHQLRGRVGRGEHQGLCLLVTRAQPGSPAADRVQALSETTDGFQIAEFDLEQRREGDVLGSRQSGATSSLRVLQVTKDREIIMEARRAAERLLAVDPVLDRHPRLREAVIARLNPDERAALHAS